MRLFFSWIFLKEPHKTCLTSPRFPQHASEIPLKYSRASSSRHIFGFIVCNIKRGNYLISELWKHVCYEKTSKLSFNWCHFSRCWQGAYLFGTFPPSLIKLHIHIPEWRWEFHFALFCHNWNAWCVPANSSINIRNSFIHFYSNATILRSVIALIIWKNSFNYNSKF